jgi:Flp pilus assembly protein TadG
VTAPTRLVLHDERGQALVFVVLALGVLIAVLALVVDVGNWMRAQRHAQSVADAAALAAAQQLPDQSAAAGEVGSSALQNSWSGPPLQSAFPDASTIKVVAQQDVSGLFAPLAGIFDISISAHASASVQSPASIVDVAPVALKCNASCSAWTNGIPFTFTFDQDNPDTNSMTAVELPGIQNRNDFQTFVQCDAQHPTSASCNSTTATAPTWYAPLVLGPGNSQGARLRTDLTQAEGSVHLVPVFDDYSNTKGYHVIGWAAGTFSVHNGGGQTATMDVTFQKLVVDGRALELGAQSTATDFGVRAIALTG